MSEIKIGAKLTISRPTYGDGRKKISIRVLDEGSRTRFLELEIDYDNFAEVITGLSEVECEGVVRNLERVGKTMEHTTIKFPFNYDGPYSGRDEAAYKAAVEWIETVRPDEGWIVENYFGSKDSFGTEQGIKYAKCTIRRYV